jgi:hypothetical protein
VSPHSKVQPTVQQYRERSPNPYVGMKEKGETDKETVRQRTNLAGNLQGIYRRKYVCQSTHGWC